MLRPKACRWFEIITTRDELAPVLETLARTGAVELQTHERGRAPLVVGDAQRLLGRFADLARLHRPHWPEAHGHSAARITDPMATLGQRLGQLEQWSGQAEPLIAELERLTAQSEQLSDLARLLSLEGSNLPAPDLLASAGRFMVELRLYAVPAGLSASEWPADVLYLRLQAALHDYAVLVGRRELMDAVDEIARAHHARHLLWPADLRGSATQARDDVRDRLAVLAQRRSELQASLQALNAQHDVSAALGDIAVVEWLIHHGTSLSTSEHLVWITGWTTAGDSAALCAPVEAAGMPCLLHFADPPPGTVPPSQLANPPWARAFEAFARLLGQPGRDEADPSALLALIAPLLFGFMFGDVGQGAVLVVAGALLRRRVPMLTMLIPGGLMAMVFGLLFGSVFASEDVVAALWLHPLDEPVVVLAVAVGLGAMILLGGLVLNAAQAVWSQGARAWWAQDAGLMCAYLGLLMAARWVEALWLVALGLLWTSVGTAAGAPEARALALGRGAARFVEQFLQLTVSTVSFARVGAFALAHAGLSVAIVGVAEAAGAVGYWLVMVLGNVLILLLEGLVVGIQTTRLMLFEFFLRFLKGTGRAFAPLPPPLVHRVP